MTEPTVPIGELEQKLDALFDYASEYRRAHPDVVLEQGPTLFSRTLGLTESYLSNAQKQGRLKVLVERALLLRFGLGPTDSELAEFGADAWARSAGSLRTWRTESAALFKDHLTATRPQPRDPDNPHLRRVIEQVQSKIGRHQEVQPESPSSIGEAGRVQDAFRFAFERSVRPRATGVHAISHLMQVAGIVLENHGTEDEAVAAFLHDLAEDYGGEPMLTEIEARFGANVASIVRECSDSIPADGVARKEWFSRKREFLERMPSKSVSALRVIAADKLHNARAMYRDGRTEGDFLWEKLKRTKEETVAYFSVGQRILAARLPSSITAELGMIVALLESSFCDPVLLAHKIANFSRTVRY